MVSTCSSCNLTLGLFHQPNAKFQSDPLKFICCLVSRGPSRLGGIPTITSATAYDSPSAANLRRGDRCHRTSVAVWKSLGAQGSAFLGAVAPPAAIPAPTLCDRAGKRPEVQTLWNFASSLAGCPFALDLQFARPCVS